MSNPVAGLTSLIPRWLFILYAIAAIGGAVANNVITFYASGLTLQSVGVPLRRYQATMLDTSVSTILVIYVVFISSSFLTDVNDFLSLLLVWIGPFAGVWLVDGTLRRWSYDPVDIHTIRAGSRYWGWRGINVKGLVAMLAGAVVCLLTIDSPILHGPISKALAGADRHGHDPPLQVVSWVEEEASGFGQLLLGSRLATGRIDERELRAGIRALDDGRPFFDHAREAGLEPERTSEATGALANLTAWIELHIEQGRVLEDAGEQLGVVEAIAGYVHADIEILGHSDHAGATPMGHAATPGSSPRSSSSSLSAWRSRFPARASLPSER